MLQSNNPTAYSVHTGTETGVTASGHISFVWSELRAAGLQSGRENLMFEGIALWYHKWQNEVKAVNT